MKIPDVNLVVAGARLDHAHHAAAKSWWHDAILEATEERPVCLLPVVVSGFLRIVTHPKIFFDPSSIGEATAHIDALLSLPNVSLLDVQPRWDAFRQLVNDHSLEGNAIPDGWIAATVTAANGHHFTFDRDFRKLLRRAQVTILSG